MANSNNEGIYYNAVGPPAETPSERRESARADAQGRERVELFNMPSRARRRPVVNLRPMPNQHCQGSLLCLNNQSRRENRRFNEMSRQLGSMNDSLAETRAILQELLPVAQETRDAAVGGQENIAEVTSRIDNGFGRLRTLFRTEHSRSSNPLQYVYLYYYTLYTLLRLSCESLISVSKPFREYLIALPCGLSLLVIIIYLIMFLLCILLYEAGIFFGSFGLLHYSGHQHDVFAIIFGTSLKIVGVVLMGLWNLKGFFRPYATIMKDSFMSGFRLNDPAVQGSVSEGADLVQDYVKNASSDAVAHIVNQGIVAAGDRLHFPSMENISSAVVAGMASHAIGARDAIASGASDLGSAVASGASDLGSAVASGAKGAAGKASELGSAAAGKASELGSAAIGKASELGAATAGKASELGSAAASGAKAAASATTQAASKAAESAAKWFKGQGGGLSEFDRFKEFDDIHILKGKQLTSFNKSKMGRMLEKLKTNMDMIMIHNVAKNIKNPINKKAIYAMNCTINLILDKGIPLLINELNNSVPLVEYIKHHKVVLNKTYNEELLHNLCAFDIMSFYQKNRLSKHKQTIKHLPRRHARLTRRHSFG